MNNIRTYIPGSNWLYFKIYTGYNTSDFLIKETFPQITESLIKEKIITKWFFIRYTDPDFHVRLRILLSDSNNIGYVILSIHNLLQKFVEDNFIWKLQIDTYNREIERYGKLTMELSESIFYYDSKTFINMLQIIEGKDEKDLRWQSALASVDYLLDDFSFDLTQKLQFISNVRNNFSLEFGLDKSKLQLSAKYRKFKHEIEEILRRKDTKYQNIHTILASRSEQQKNVIGEIILILENNESIFNILSSYTHMMMNRWFSTKQRLHEAVIYDFLYKYYKSEIAKNHLT